MKQWRNHHVRKVSFLMVFQELWSKHRRYDIVFDIWVTKCVSFVWKLGLCIYKNRITWLYALFYMLFIYIFWICFFFICSLMRCCKNKELKLIRCSILQLMMQSLRSELLVAGYTHPVAELTIQNFPLQRFLVLMM